MATIVPAILVDDYQTFKERVEMLPDDVHTVSVDIMDGTFVEPSSFGNATSAADLNTDVQYELDLMVADPLPYIRDWSKRSNTIRAIVHAELDTDMRELVREIKSLKLEAGIALLPKTSVSDVEHLLNDVDMVLVRGNEPGYAGRKLDPAIYKKVIELKEEYPHLMITVDIGVNANTIPDLVASGASHLSVNSAIYKQEDPIIALRELQYLAGA